MPVVFVSISFRNAKLFKQAVVILQEHLEGSPQGNMGKRIASALSEDTCLLLVVPRDGS